VVDTTKVFMKELWLLIQITDIVIHFTDSGIRFYQSDNLFKSYSNLLIERRMLIFPNLSKSVTS